MNIDNLILHLELYDQLEAEQRLLWQEVIC